MSSDVPSAGAPPIEIVRPLAHALPVVLASPHSGDAYPADFLDQTHLPLSVLRRSEDAFVDRLFGLAARNGVPLLRALYPRSFVDPNREPWELDPAMFEGPPPANANSRSPRVAAGLGVVPRVAFDGQQIYRRRLPGAEFERRIAWYYRPYHAALTRLIAETTERFGHCILVDCHSMPSAASGSQTPGVKPGRKEHKMGQRASNTTDVIFEDCKLPASALVGSEDGGFKVAMKTFDRSRPWIAATAAGVIRRSLEESRAYALERKTFGVPIAQHQAIQFMLAEMAISYEATRLLTHKAAWQVDKGDLSAITSAYAKAYGADAAMRASTDAVQIFGGYGYTKEYPVEKLMRDAKLLQIYEGTSQIQRVVIARNVLGGK